MKKVFILISVMLLLLPAGSANAQEKENSEAVKLPIVMYHHLSHKQKLWGKFTLPVDQFEEDLKYLKSEGYESISIKQLMAWYEGQCGLPEKPVMITFDDGYESTLAYAKPLLEKYGFCAVVSIIGSAADLFTEKEDHMLDYSYLSWEAVSELSHTAVFEIQYHTFDMHKQSSRSGCMKKKGECFEKYEEAISDDVKKFRERCKQYNVAAMPTVAFPFGAYCVDTLLIMRNLGYIATFSCRERVNLLCGDPEEILTLGRYNRAYGKGSEAFFQRWK